MISKPSPPPNNSRATPTPAAQEPFSLPRLSATTASMAPAAKGSGGGDWSRALFPLPRLPPPHSNDRVPVGIANVGLRKELHSVVNHMIDTLNALKYPARSERSSTRSSNARGIAPQTPTAAQLACIASLMKRCFPLALRRVQRRSALALLPTAVSSISLKGATAPHSAERDVVDLSAFGPEYTSCAHVPLVAERLSLPSENLKPVDPLPLLPPKYQRLYGSEGGGLMKGVPTIVHDGRVFGTQKEWIKTVRMGLANGMMGYTRTPRVVNSVFAVPKDGGAAQRLIINAKPLNAIAATPDAVRLPTAELIGDLKVTDGKPLFVAKTDLGDFYHRIRLGDWMGPFFALPRVRAAEVGVSGGGFVYPTCRTLPMGFSHSVLIAQMIHERIVRDAGIFEMAPQLTSDTPCVVGDGIVRCQIYIDDFVVYGTDREAVQRVLDAYVKAVTAAGFVVKSSKTVAPTTDGVKCIGITVNGKDHTAGVDVDSLCDLIEETRSMLALGRASGLEMSRVVGSWTWAMLVQRPSLSLFSSVYQFIQRCGESTAPITEGVRRELNDVCAIAPILTASLSGPTLPQLIATDSSEGMYGVCTATVSAREACAVADATLSSSRVALAACGEGAGEGAGIARGWLRAIAANLSLPLPFSGFTQTLPTVKANSDFLYCIAPQLAADRYGAHPTPTPLRLSAFGEPPLNRFDLTYQRIRRLRWRVAVSDHWTQPLEHINCKEVRATEVGVRTALEQFGTGAFDSRIVVFTDSLVGLHALSKGRSGSFGLLRGTRRIAAYCLVTGIKPLYRYIGSELNPADGPSRSKQRVGTFVESSDNGTRCNSGRACGGGQSIAHRPLHQPAHPHVVHSHGRSVRGVGDRSRL